jgi:PAS domain-containing protein
MTARAGGRRPQPWPGPDEDYLKDYAALLEGVPYPSVLLDRRWDVVLANEAFTELFRPVGPHPTAMPHDNFLRFVLFHPDAGLVLAEREVRWCLPALARFAFLAERFGDDPVLQAVRREIAEDPLMEAAYRQGLPHWVHTVGERAAREHDGSIRPLSAPEAGRPVRECRLVVETPSAFAELGYERMTLVLPEPGPEPEAGPVREGAAVAASRQPRARGHLSLVRSARPEAPRA